MEQSKQKLRDTLDSLLLEQIDAEIVEPSGFVGSRDPRNHVSLGRMKERLKAIGFDIQSGVPQALTHELACRAVRLNNERRLAERN
ncbi:hypothetical protein ACPV5U_18530 [Vibrio mediterranei]